MYCIDAGSDYCPCHLAETGDCILCSQLSGEKFCQCKNWCGVCIYEQYISNGNKAKSLRKSYSCAVLNNTLDDEDLLTFTLKAPEVLIHELVFPGSFVFIRNEESINYYDVPISVMDANCDNGTLKFAVKLVGPKTKALSKLSKGKNVLVRGPFSNGIMGISNINKAKGGTSVIAARGIAEAPSIPVIKKLHSNGNKVISIIDTQFKNNFAEKYFKDYSSKIINCNMLNNGYLSNQFKSILKEITDTENVNLIHCGGPDILTYRIIDFVDNSINLSCCNNSKIVCGEGICASCTKHFNDDSAPRLCKVQLDPRDLFKDRRFL